MKRMIGITALFLLSASALARPPAKYEPAPDINSPGYVTAPADNGRFTVVYTGARGMKPEQVAEYALLRAAEFTTESGQEWFAVIDKKAQKVQLAPQKDDLRSRGGGFIDGGGGASTGAGAAGGASSPRGVSDSTTAGGASTGGFGGGAPPTSVTERWTPPRVPQTIIVIQMGTGDQAKFPGLDKAPEIFAAKTVAQDIRAKMKP